jgi:ribosomal-protein-alanine N-acetyltransferase
VSMEVRVRLMTEADLDTMAALTANLPTAPQWPREAYRVALNPQAAPIRIALVAETDVAGVVGFAIVSVIAPEAELESIAVAEEFQRMGVAGRLFEALTDELATSGVTEILLEVRASNTSALSLYRVLGFWEIGRRTGYYAHPMEDAVQMRRKIE